jgi:hypothetical protein
MHYDVQYSSQQTKEDGKEEARRQKFYGVDYAWIPIMW